MLRTLIELPRITASPTSHPGSAARCRRRSTPPGPPAFIPAGNGPSGSVASVERPSPVLRVVACVPFVNSSIEPLQSLARAAAGSSTGGSAILHRDSGGRAAFLDACGGPAPGRPRRRPDRSASPALAAACWCAAGVTVQTVRLGASKVVIDGYGVVRRHACTGPGDTCPRRRWSAQSVRRRTPRSGRASGAAAAPAGRTSSG